MQRTHSTYECLTLTVQDNGNTSVTFIVCAGSCLDVESDVSSQDRNCRNRTKTKGRKKKMKKKININK